MNDQVTDRRHLEAVFGGELEQIRSRRKFAVGVEDRRQHGDGLVPRKNREIHRPLGVAGAP